jgi:hypothetical protein
MHSLALRAHMALFHKWRNPLAHPVAIEVFEEWMPAG